MLLFRSNDGKHKNTNHTVTRRADVLPRSGDVGYPLTTQLDNGTLFTIDAITTDDGSNHVAGTYGDPNAIE